MGPSFPRTLLCPVSLLSGWWSSQKSRYQYRNHLVGLVTNYSFPQSGHFDECQRLDWPLLLSCSRPKVAWPPSWPQPWPCWVLNFLSQRVTDLEHICSASQFSATKTGSRLCIAQQCALDLVHTYCLLLWKFRTRRQNVTDSEHICLTSSLLLTTGTRILTEPHCSALSFFLPTELKV